jgi:hypothetical protein
LNEGRLIEQVEEEGGIVCGGLTENQTARFENIHAGDVLSRNGVIRSSLNVPHASKKQKDHATSGRIEK